MKDDSIIAEKVIIWDIAQNKIVIMLKFRCERNSRFKIKNAINAHTA